MSWTCRMENINHLKQPRSCFKNILLQILCDLGKIATKELSPCLVAKDAWKADRPALSVSCCAKWSCLVSDLGNWSFWRAPLTNRYILWAPFCGLLPIPFVYCSVYCISIPIYLCWIIVLGLNGVHQTAHYLSCRPLAIIYFQQLSIFSRKDKKLLCISQRGTQDGKAVYFFSIDIWNDFDLGHDTRGRKQNKTFATNQCGELEFNQVIPNRTMGSVSQAGERLNVVAQKKHTNTHTVCKIMRRIHWHH